ncbi:MAG: hypothetical protein RXO36_01500 [Candidatus Nanopusillus acidilobi]
MKELLHIEQNDEFPNFFNGIILNLPDTNAINVIDYDLNMNTYTNLKVSYPFYFGFIPRTFIDNYPLFFSFFSDKKFNIFNLLKLEPLYFFKVPKDITINIVYSKLPDQSINIDKNSIENILKDFFEVDTIPSLLKPSHILENTNREYKRKFSKIKKL